MFKMVRAFFSQLARGTKHLRNKLRGHSTYRNGFDKFIKPSVCSLSGNAYTIITVANNASLYLDDYFRSLTTQRLNFIKHIKIVIVDQNSTDETPRIVSKWKKKYPNNIHYVLRELVNKDFELPFITEGWVTFIDADDLVHPNYFWLVDCLLGEFGDYGVKMLCCKQKTFFPKKNKFRDSCPQGNCFKHDARLYPYNGIEDYYHFSLNATFFLVKEIKRQAFTFTFNLGWGGFEAGHSVLRYIKGIESGHVLFSNRPTYYVRSTSEGAVSKSVKNKSHYLGVLEHGYLDILKLYSGWGRRVPEFVQQVILYELSVKIIDIEVSGPPKSVLSEGELERFSTLCAQIFEYINCKVIWDFPEGVSGFSEPYKLGVLSCFKNSKLAGKTIFFDKYNAARRQVRVTFYTAIPNVEYKVIANEEIVDVLFPKITQRFFLSQKLVNEVSFWFNLDKSVESFSVLIDGDKALFSLAGAHKISVSALEVVQSLTEGSLDTSCKSSCWVLLDRPNQANDNAEHLYRYLAKEYPEKEIFFAISRSSNDYHRLREEGFNLLDFGSRRYLNILKRSSMIVSSHLDEDSRKEGLGKPFVFLQHGVIVSDLSVWFRSRRISLLITTTPFEYDTVVSDFSPYNLCLNEVVLTGLPRHDSLLSAQKRWSEHKMVIIMPTWRKSLFQYLSQETSVEKKSKLLEISLYGRYWLSFLRSEEFKNLVTAFGYEVVFWPHSGMSEEFRRIRLPSYIRFCSSSDSNIQELFSKASCLVTDYSSVAFEMGYLFKPVVYYQFDQTDFFDGGHAWRRGNFNYRQHGFGPVVENQKELLEAIAQIFMNDGGAGSVYRQRMADAFIFRDGANCKRVYEAISRLERRVGYSRKR